MAWCSLDKFLRPCGRPRAHRGARWPRCAQGAPQPTRRVRPAHRGPHPSRPGYSLYQSALTRSLVGPWQQAGGACRRLGVALWVIWGAHCPCVFVLSTLPTLVHIRRRVLADRGRPEPAPVCVCWSAGGFAEEGAREGAVYSHDWLGRGGMAISAARRYVVIGSLAGCVQTSVANGAPAGGICATLPPVYSWGLPKRRAAAHLQHRQALYRETASATRQAPRPSLQRRARVGERPFSSASLPPHRRQARRR